MPSVISRNAGPEFSDLERRFALFRAAQAQQESGWVPSATPEPIPPERLQLASANIQHLSGIIRQLVELRQQEESDEYGQLRASEHAFDTACHLVTDAAIAAAMESRQIPQGWASTDAEGGIRIEWVRPASGVHLVIPASDEGDGYIYHEVGDDFATEVATPETLARWLREVA